MIKNKQIFSLGKASFIVDPKKSNIAVRVGDMRFSIKKNELWAMVFAISSQKEQDDLIPKTKNEMMQFDRVHTIKATKDIKAGETIKFHCHVDVPLTIVEAHLTKEDMDGVRATIALDQKGIIPIPAIDGN